jgi:putative phage-type endonuclease
VALTNKQRIDRQSGLGGSDIAAILGLSRYASPIDIYNDKVGVLPEDIGNEAINRGNLLEPIIISRYEEVSGHKVEVGHETLLHADYPFLRANIDGMQKDSIIEAKSVHKWAKAAKEFGEEGTDQIPTEYLVQCAFYNEVVTKCDRVIIPTAFVIDNSGSINSIDRFGIYKYERNEKLGQGIIQKAVHFWEEHVVKRIPPAGASLRKATPSVSEKVAIEVDKRHIEEIKLLDAMIKEYTEEKKIRVQAIQENMEEFELLKDEKGKELASWKMQYSNRFDLKAFEKEHPDLYKQYIKQINSRVFRLKGETGSC